MKFHVPVLLQEVIDALNVKPNGLYIDATLGGGGHTFEILKAGGKVLGIDLDRQALDYVVSQIEPEYKDNLILSQGNFKDIAQIAKDNGFEKVDGILLDLGVSSHQIDSPERGFSFMQNGPLDMRMDKDSGVPAKDLVNALHSGELYELFTKLGEEHNAKAISNSIVSAREIAPIETTGQLADAVARAFGLRGEVKPFMKAKVNQKVFQALRIAVNDEMNNLREVLPAAQTLLKPEGRLAVISFHSMEDRIVKHQFLEFEKYGRGNILTKHPITASADEAEENSRSHSAKLRVFEQTEDTERSRSTEVN